MSSVYVVNSKDISFDRDAIVFTQKEDHVTINVKDVIGCEPVTIKGTDTSGPDSKISKSSASHIVHYSNKKKDYTWEHGNVYLCGNVGTTQDLVTRVEGKIAQDTDRPKRLLILVNPIGGNHNAKSILRDVVTPLLKLAKISTDVCVSERPKHMVEIISAYDLSEVDGVVVFGGDGSVLEVMNYLVRKSQTDAGIDIDNPESVFAPVQVPVGVIPTGTGNKICECLYGVADCTTAALHVIRGNVKKRKCLGIYSGGKWLSYCGLALAYGLFSDVMYHTDKQRWMKKLRSAIVPLYVMLWKKRRFFNAHITYYTRKKEDKTTKQSEELQKKDIEGQYLNLLSFNGNYITETGETCLSVEAERVCDQSLLNIFCFKQIGRLSMIGEFVKLYKNDPTALHHEEIDIYNVVGYKVKVEKSDHTSTDPDSEDNILYGLLNVDGEQLNITNGEYDVMYKFDVCQFYTSLMV